jgi:superfamily II DNA or RNA helicase
MGRNFSDKQKEVLYAISEGKCALCGEALKIGWHADHIIPYSKGGKTDIVNGQALCKKCNIRKGDEIMTNEILQWPNNITPRLWQSDFIADYFSKDWDDYLAFAFPASGKTYAGLMIAYQLLKRGVVQQIIIVSPTDHLRTQWINDANDFGIDLTHIGRDPLNKSLAYSSDYVGVSTTYPQVNFNKDPFRHLCSKNATFVILDEVHHCGDDEWGNSMEWGEAIKHAFAPCQKRLLITGTPFRSDNYKIPFVKYEYNKEDGNHYAQLDFSYGYGEALQDTPDEHGNGVVRPVIFPVFDSKVGWVDLSGETYHLLSEATKKDRGRALNIALNPKGEWLRGVLREADGRLNAIRKNSNHKNAGGLVVARDTTHADEIAKVMESVTGEFPAIVHSKLEESNDPIKAFKNSNQKWLVSVRMVSEGIDINRLRVGVYLSPITTRMYFFQVVGRVLRWVRGVDMQMAFFYFPMIEPFTGYMKEMSDIVRDSYKDIDVITCYPPRKDKAEQKPLFVPIYGDITEKGQIHGAQEYDEPTLDVGVEVFQKHVPGIGGDIIKLMGEAKATEISYYAGWMPGEGTKAELSRQFQENKPTSKHDERKHAKTLCNAAINRYAGLLLRLKYFDTFADAVRAINTEYGKKYGYATDDKPIAYYYSKASWAHEKMGKHNG